MHASGRLSTPLGSVLYLPVKHFLEKLGFEVKGEVCGCDVVALNGNGPAAVVTGELKVTFTLDLVLQAVDRSSVCDEVWLAVRASQRGRGRERDRRVHKLCRLLGLGLLSVTAPGKVDMLVEPGPWRPRRAMRSAAPGLSKSIGGARGTLLSAAVPVSQS